MGGRQTVLFMTGPVSALSLTSQIPETGKYFNCKHPWLDSLRGPPVRLFHLLLTHLLSLHAQKTCLHEYKTTHAKKHLCTFLIYFYNTFCNYATKLHVLRFRVVLHILSDTCVLQLPSKSTVIEISLDTTRCLGAARRSAVQ